jgi:hypothetical protein
MTRQLKSQVGRLRLARASPLGGSSGASAYAHATDQYIRILRAKLSTGFLGVLLGRSHAMPIAPCRRHAPRAAGTLWLCDQGSRESRRFSEAH